MANVDICPTVTAADPHSYREQIERVVPFAKRIHIDLADGQFAPVKLIDIDRVWWPGGMRADLHVMYQRPFEHLETLIALGPQLIIVHAEADGDFEGFSKTARGHGIEVGVALLPGTSADLIKPSLGLIDHVLIFSGNLGYQGGSQAHFDLLNKARALKASKPNLEIGWDGGVNDANAAQLAQSGIEVLNVGGFIQKSSDPAGAYAKLEQITGGNNAAFVSS